MSGALAYQEEYKEYELIDGEVYMMARPSLEHIAIEDNITVIFKNYLQGKRCRSFSEPDVYLSEQDHVIPDAVIVCNLDLLRNGRVNGAPDLIVEILSPSTARNDKLRKKAIYEKYGVKEYWIVDPINKSIEVFHLIDGKLMLENVCMMYRDYEWERMTEEEKELARKEQLSIQVSLYDDFTIDVADVFRGVD